MLTVGKANKESKISQVFRAKDRRVKEQKKKGCVSNKYKSNMKGIVKNILRQSDE